MSRETVLDDYEVTSRYRGPAQTPEVVDLFVSWGMTRAAAIGLLGTPRWAMARTLEHLDADYGGIERYLLDAGQMTANELSNLRASMVEWPSTRT